MAGPLIVVSIRQRILQYGTDLIFQIILGELNAQLRKERVIEPEPEHQLFALDPDHPAWRLLLCEVPKPQRKYFNDVLLLSSVKLLLKG